MDKKDIQNRNMHRTTIILFLCILTSCNPYKKISRTWETHNGLSVISLHSDQTYEIKSYPTFTESGTWTYENNWLVFHSSTTDSVYFELISRDEAILSNGPDSEFKWTGKAFKPYQLEINADSIQNLLISNYFQIRSPIFEDQKITRDIDFFEKGSWIFDNEINFILEYEVFDFENNTFIYSRSFLGELVCKITKLTKDSIECDCILYSNNLIFKMTFCRIENQTQFVRSNEIIGRWESTDDIDIIYPDQIRNRFSTEFIEELKKNEVYNQTVLEDPIEIIEIEVPEIDNSVTPPLPSNPDSASREEPFYISPQLVVSEDRFNLSFENKHYEGNWKISKSGKIMVLHDETIKIDFYLNIFKQENEVYFQIDLFTHQSEYGTKRYLLKKTTE